MTGAVKDKTGNRYGKLVVTELHSIRNGLSFWTCKCDCGNTKVVSTGNLRKGQNKSCGCVSKDLGPGTTFKDETGKKYNKLTAIRPEGKRGCQVAWLCECDCGNTTIVAGGDLRSGKTKSCGCGRKTQGGCYKTTEYCSWKEMHRRCYNKNYKEYRNYGGRGIKICDEWIHSFTNFLNDMGKKPTPDCTIDRINNDGDYEKSNCRWATPMTQGNNTRKVKLITHDGKTLSIRGWAREVGMPYPTLQKKLSRGIELADAIAKA